MLLTEKARYAEHGLGPEAVAALALYGDLLLASRTNVTAVRDPHGVETVHFLDSLSFLDVPEIRRARTLVDVGSGGGLPAVVLAIALPEVAVTAVDSVGKKCAFVEEVRDSLGLANLEVVCARAEDAGRSRLREVFDVAVARAVAALPVLSELAVPLIRPGGTFVAAKGALSDQERMEGETALGILGSDQHRLVRARSFEGAENRWLFVAIKERATPEMYPRRPGVPVKRPLGATG
ncbi:MAG: 16S rRNA (guanine(527)-N(7))-methyltransferase RsmG [Thermoleophilia bacterium]